MRAKLENPVKMIRQGAPRLIHSEEELEEYTQVLFELTAKADPTPAEEDAIELMTLLVDCFETERYPIMSRRLADSCGSE